MPKWFWLSALAALIFGIYAIPLKKASFDFRNTGDIMVMLFWTGVAVSVSAGIGMLFFKGSLLTVPFSLTVHSLVGGALWFLGMVAVMVAFREPNASIGLIACVYDSNALVAMLMGFIFFKEHKTTDLRFAIMGALFIVIGAGLVGIAGSSKK